MTTCAWDGLTLAADTQAHTAGLRYSTTKAFRLKDGRLFAGCGCASQIAAVRSWLEGGIHRPTKTDDFSALVIDAGKCFRIEEGLELIEVNERFHAIGSGRDFAISAMHFGFSAIEAVKFAALYDVYTGEPVTAMQCDQSSDAPSR